MAAIMPNYRGTSTTATNDITSTDSSQMYWYYDDYEEIKTQVEEKFNKELMKESVKIPSFKVVKKLHNTKKIKTFVEKRQQNFNIRNSI